MKKMTLILFLVTLFLVWDVSRSSSNTVIIYTPLEQFRSDELKKQLDEHFPDLNIQIMYMSTGKTAAKISVEKESTDADILIALESSYMEKIKKSLEDSSQYSHLEYLDEFTDYDRYLIWDREAGSIVINTEVLEKHHLPIPHTYEDLLDPVYKDLIAMPDPKSSGTGYFFYKNLVNEWGEERALEYFDKLALNIKQFTESGSGPLKLLVQKEIAIGLGMTFQAVDELNKGNPLILLEPEFGAPYSLTAMAMIKGRSSNENVVRVYKYIANDFMLYDKEYFCPDKVLVKQENYIPNYPENIRYANMQGMNSVEEKERLLKLWKY